MYQTKTVTVGPGMRLGLHKHERTSEYWIVVAGSGKLTHRAVTMKGDTVFGDRTIYEGDIVRIEPGEWHDVANKTTEPLVFIAVWLGDKPTDITAPQTGDTNHPAK